MALKDDEGSSMIVDSDDEGAGETSFEDVPPPDSARAGSVLIESYTWHSHEGTNPHAEGPRGREEWVMGIDEAGRGPVLGPQVYSVAYSPKSYSDELRNLGFADSKTLSHAKRLTLLDVLGSRPDNLKWAVRVMSPHDISRHMLQRMPYNLNAQSHDATALLIREVLAKGFNVTEIFVDTVGPAQQYQEKLEKQFSGITFTVESKADYKYPIVGAASIGAKVTRDAIMAHWTYLEPGLNASLRDASGSSTYGSGYPSDPRTSGWLSEHCDPVFGLPQIARFSWGTVKHLLEKRGVKSRWDEPMSIQRYFDPNAAAAVDKTRPALWKDMSLQSVDAF